VNRYHPIWSNQNTNYGTIWLNDTKNVYKITIGNTELNKMQIGYTNTIIYSQQLSMGYDTFRIYNLSSYINIFVAKPDIESKINA